MTGSTKKLYLTDSYIKEFDAIVTKIKKNYVCLDKSAFYPVGGGQPSDIGFINWNDNKVSEVVEVVKKGDSIKHILNKGVGLCHLYQNLK